MILVDTSVWVDHLRRGNPSLASLLAEALVLCHPFIVGELACGNLRRRGEIISLLRRLPSAPLTGHDEVLDLVQERRLWGSGIGWVDAHLLGASLLSGAKLWTLDRPLRDSARLLGVSRV